MSYTGCDASSPIVDSHCHQSTHCDDNSKTHRHDHQGSTNHYGTVDSPVSSTCDVSSPSDYSQYNQSPHSDTNFQVQGYSHHHGSTVLPVSTTSGGVTAFNVPAYGRRFVGLIFFGLFPTIVGIVLLSQARSWSQSFDPVFSHISSPNPFIISGSVFLSFGCLFIMGGLYGMCSASRRQQQQQQQQQLLLNTHVVRPPPVVSGQLNLPSRTPSAPPQFQNENTGQEPFNEPPPPYWSKEAPPPPTYRY